MAVTKIQNEKLILQKTETKSIISIDIFWYITTRRSTLVEGCSVIVIGWYKMACTKQTNQIAYLCAHANLENKTQAANHTYGIRIKNANSHALKLNSIVDDRKYMVVSFQRMQIDQIESN